MSEHGDAGKVRKPGRLFIGVALVVVMAGAGTTIAMMQGRAKVHARVVSANLRAAQLAASSVSRGASTDEVAASWIGTGGADELLFVDAAKVVTVWEAGVGKTGAPLVGHLEALGGGSRVPFGDALTPGVGVSGRWYHPDGDGLVAAAPVGPDGGWVVVMTPLTRLRALLLPLLLPVCLLVFGLGWSTISLLSSLRAVRSARDIAGVVGTTRSAERHRLRRVTQDLPALLFEYLILPDGEGVFTWVSPNARDIVETEDTEIVVHPERVFGWMEPEALASMRRVAQAAREVESAFRWEGRLRLPSGRTRWFRALAHLAEVSEEEERWCGFLVDITEERVLEEQLKQRGRLATVGQLAAGVAHEINNPLSYIIGNTRYVLEAVDSGDVSLPDEMKEALADAVDGAERVAGIVQDLRTLARGGELGEEGGAVDLVQVLRTACRQIDMDVRFRARLDFEAPDDVPYVYGHDGRLVQVFYNLLRNAILSIEPGDPASNVVRVAIVSSREWVRVRIEDTGHGIPAHIRDRIFDPFFTTRDGTQGREQGQGLGLSVCLSIVSRLGGELKLASTELAGACFEVTLRTETGSAETASAEGGVTPLTVPLRLLLVDDEDALLRAARRRLKPHDVVGVSSGTAALSLLAQDSSFDAVMCDVMMSGMSGVEVYESLKERLPEYARRFVFMTGGSVSLEIEQWLEQADLPLVEKPLRKDVVAEALAGIVARTAGERSEV